jgi:hypothetical protein
VIRGGRPGAHAYNLVVAATQLGRADMFRGLRIARKPAVLVLLCGTFGCAPLQITTNPDAFPVPLDNPVQLRGNQSIDLLNAYKTQTQVKIFLGGPTWEADLRQYTQSAITLLGRELRKSGATIEPSNKSIVLRVHNVQSAPGAFLIPGSLVLDAEYGDGTKSSVAEQDNASSAWRAIDGAMVRAVAKLLADERFQAYVNGDRASAPGAPVSQTPATRTPGRTNMDELDGLLKAK